MKLLRVPFVFLNIQLLIFFAVFWYAGVSNHKLGEKSCQENFFAYSEGTSLNFSGVDVEMEKMCHTPSIVDQQRSSPGQTGRLHWNLHLIQKTPTCPNSLL